MNLLRIRAIPGQLLSAHRNVASSRTASLSFGASGTVTAVPAKAGDTVKAGQVLATIDDDTAQRTLNSARAELKSARASYDELAEGQTDAEDALADTAIEAPFAGTVVSVAGEVDELEPLEPDAGGDGERRRDGTSGVEGRRHCRAFRAS